MNKRKKLPQKIFKKFAQNRFVGLMFLCCLSGVAYSSDSLSVNEVQLTQQSSTITGTVLDELGEPIIGATVKVKNNPAVGTITNIDGSFSLKVDPNEILEISYVGYKSQEVKAQNGMRVMLQIDSKTFDDVVVVGYGVQKKVNVTGSIGTIDGSTLKDRPNADILATAQGQVAGVTIITRPGATPTINFRGRGSTGGASSPLYVIDGVISDATFFSRLDPNDIQSISFLKDAASSSIYGSRAAYGVVLVDTKKGKEGKPQINYNGYVGIKNATYRPKPLDAGWYVGLQAEGNYNDRVLAGQNPSSIDVNAIRNEYLANNLTNPDLYPNTNWFDLVLDDNATITSHSLSFSGGNKALRHNTSVGYVYDQSFIPGQSTNRFNFSSNLSSDITSWLTLRSNVKYILNRRKRKGSINYINLLYVPSTFAAKQSNGDYGTIQGYPDGGKVGSANYALNNPLRSLEDGGWQNVDNTKYSITVGGDIKPLEGLEISGDLNYNYDDYKAKTYQNSWDNLTNFISKQELVGSNRINKMDYDWRSSYRLLATGVARYNKTFGDKHNFGAIVGTSYEYFTYERLTASRSGFPNNDMTNIAGGSSVKDGNYTNGGEAYNNRLFSYFGRVNYNYDEKYLFEFNVRADGSSKFVDKWGYFPSFSLGWRMSEESFMKDVTWIQNLKWRGSWGKLGNNSVVGNYDYYATYAMGNDYNFNDQLVNGIYTGKPASKMLTWEKVTITDLGFDLDLFDGRTGITFDYYNKITDDILLGYSLLNEVGASGNMSGNIGSLRNRGFELAARYGKTFGDFSFDVSANISKNWNKVLDMGASGTIYSDPWITAEGYPIGSYYVYKTDGLYTQEDIDSGNYTIANGRKPIAGDIKYVKTADDGTNVINGNDRIISKSDVPDFTYGLSMNFGYRDFDLSISGYGVSGVHTYFGSEMAIAYFNNANPKEYHLGRWTEENPNPNAVYPRIYTGSGQAYNNLQSDFWLFDASFFRIKNITLGYSVPPVVSNKWGVSGLKLYLAVENPFTIRGDKRMKDFDPETASGRGQDSRGTQTFTFGVNVSF